MKIHSRQASDIFRGKQRGNTEDGTGRSGACSVFFLEKKTGRDLHNLRRKRYEAEYDDHF